MLLTCAQRVCRDGHPWPPDRWGQQFCGFFFFLSLCEVYFGCDTSGWEYSWVLRKWPVPRLLSLTLVHIGSVRLWDTCQVIDRPNEEDSRCRVSAPVPLSRLCQKLSDVSETVNCPSAWGLSMHCFRSVTVAFNETRESRLVISRSNVKKY